MIIIMVLKYYLIIFIILFIDLLINIIRVLISINYSDIQRSSIWGARALRVKITSSGSF
jgi:hypothetical protein